MTDNNKKTHLVITGRGGGGSGEQVQADWNQSDNTQPDYIKNKPELATVATTGDYDDLQNKPTIPEAQVQADWQQNDSSAVDYIKNKPSLPSAQIQSDWNQTNTSEVDYIKNKPTIPAAQVNADWNSTSGVSEILNKPSLATVATSGNYSDLNGTPSLATVATSGDYDDLQNKPTIPVVPTNVSAFTNDAGYTTFDGDYNSLTNKPTIPAAQVNSDWNANSGVSQILNKPTLATVATSGDYDDLQNKPTIPAAPVQSDWNEADSSSLAYIANKPTIPAAQVNSDWNANSGVAQILNKPIIPTVPAMNTETLTFVLSNNTTVTMDMLVKTPYFYVEDVSGSDNTLTFKKNDSTAPTVTLYYSNDLIKWKTNGGSSTSGQTITIPANSKIYFKCVANSLYSTYGGHEFNCSGNYRIGGSIMSLLYGDDYNTTVLNKNWNLRGLFSKSTTLISAANLILPATTLTPGCYQLMFSGCTSLTTAPAILPASTLTSDCYNGMFKDCSALTTAPVLPATTLAYSSYASMFYNCALLNKIVCYADGQRDTWQTGNWLYGVSTTGDFYKLGNYNFNTGASGIPSGWTVHTSL